MVAYSLFFLLLSAFSCSIDDQVDTPVPNAEGQLYTNARIYTVNDAMPWAEAMYVVQGEIVAIGTETEVLAEAEETTPRTDLGGRMVMPGIHDVHLHPLEAASDNFQFILNTAEQDPEGYSTDIAKAIVDNPSAPWILGWGSDIYTLLDAQREPIEILNELSADRPIAVMEQTSHSVWVNSKALELANINATTPNPPGGVIMKDQNGNPNGLLIDNAGNLIIDLAIASIPNGKQNDYEGLINFALPELAKNGITSICDARTYWKRNHHLTWQRAASEDKLTVRANLGLWLYPTEDDATQIQKIKDLYALDRTSLLKINQVKLYADGIVVNTTSAMDRDFLVDLFDLPTNDGLNYVTESRLGQYIAALDPLGVDFHIHAIGNRGVHEALNAIEQNAAPSARHRITHVEYVNPSDYARFANLNVVADAQVAGDFTQPDQWHENDELVDPELNENLVPIKSLKAAGARITLSSDWDVSALNPFVGLQHAVTRTPQNLSLEQAIQAYTIDPAYVMRQESIVGSLEKGKEADFIVLSQNLFEVDASRINATEVLETYLAGERVFKK